MKIAFICPSATGTSGGIFEIERRLAQSLAELPQTAVEVFSTSDENVDEYLPSWMPLQPRHFPYFGPASFRYSPGLRNSFLAMESDIAHLHALWMYNSILMSRWAMRRRRPYVITANGMLEPWAMANSRLKKRLALFFYERRCLREAACIQVNSPAEFRSLRAFGLKNPVCIIPNGIDLPPDGSRKSEVGSWKSERKILLYLGRIHPKKGLVNLFRAWKQFQRSEVRSQKSEWILAIAGWDQDGHERKLKRLATELDIPWADVRGKAEKLKTEIRKEQNAQSQERETDFSVSEFQNSSVLFLGPKFGDEKAALFRACDAFILPSFSEGLPMVVLEAWAHGKPVLMTPECNLPEGFAAHAALRIEPNVQSIAAGLEELIRSTSSDLDSMGNNGRQLVAEKFTWPKIAIEMKSVYNWVLGGGTKPDCVQIS